MTPERKRTIGRKRSLSITLSGRSLFILEGLEPFYGSPRRIVERLLGDLPEERLTRMGVGLKDWLESDAGREWAEEWDRRTAEKDKLRRRHGMRAV